MPNTGNRKKESKKIVFVDRDGVINEDLIGDYIKTWDAFKLIPGALEALQLLTRSGFELVIISNQAGIGDEIYPLQNLNDITDRMLALLKKEKVSVGKVYYCLHGKEEGCDCRKPKTGLFKLAAKDYDFDPDQTYFVGDKLTDIQAGKRFGLKTLFVLTGHGIYDQKKITEKDKPEAILPSIKEAAEHIVNHSL